uniref:Uncharacterized protein n=1 Tax=Kalanchoe fedtschenkoi TaxID=63787 RepID=A0A7N0SXG3_KALFE
MKRKGDGGGGRSRFVRLMKLPIRALSRARDYYVRRMVDCGQVSRCPGAYGVGHGLPRSFSVGSSAESDDHRSEDFRELVRAAPVRTLASGGVQVGRVARSASVGVGMGRIDEERAFEGEDEGETRKLRFDVGENGGGGGGRKQSVVFWRSKSYAVTKESVAF